MTGEQDEIENKISIEALDQLFERIRKEVYTNHIVPIVVILVMWSSVNQSLLVGWGILMLIGIWANYYIAVQYLSQTEILDPYKWGRRMSGVMLYFGLLWVYAISFFYLEDSFGLQIFLSTIALVFTIGSVMVGVYWFPMFYLLAVPVLVALIVRFLMIGTIEYIALAALVLWTLLMSGTMAKMLNARVRSEMRLRHESALLNESLKQKTTEAELATMAKSNFLAAASHDLRQPVHALSLFIDVLKEAESETERKKIYPSIDLSLEALRKLFDALLDISRLDAQVVQPEVSHFDISAVVLKLASEFNSTAKDKGLKLKVHTRSAIVISDRILLERVIRNLLANAIHYTNSGSVLLSTRKRGDHILLQVWDTGIGIPEDRKEDIFIEFLQLHNTHRDRSQGLGLGLAIVQRLCDILEHRIDLSSALGKGTVFNICLPVGDKSLIKERRPELITNKWDLSGRCIVVIDDETEILAAMKSLLSQWGSEVVAATSLSQAIAKLEIEGQIPDMVISDLRLKNNQTGLEAIDCLRSKFGLNIKGIIVTGETSPNKIRDVTNSDYLLLQKPVKPINLRMAIDNSFQLDTKDN